MTYITYFNFFMFYIMPTLVFADSTPGGVFVVSNTETEKNRNRVSELKTEPNRTGSSNPGTEPALVLSLKLENGATQTQTDL